MTHETITYLKKYAVKENYPLTIKDKAGINNVVVIPTMAELDNLPPLLDSLSKTDSKYLSETLFLFVVNNTAEAEESIFSNNQRTIEYFQNLMDDNVLEELRISYIDASSLPLPDKTGGVGLARKIGMDKALELFDYNSNSKKLLICLDADCTVSSSYLKEIVDCFNKNKIHAASIYFEHPFPAEEHFSSAIINYEIFLRYYVLSLKNADSPYAFQTIGSSMACDNISYMKIEGMNIRKAAEDFYFLQKLAKQTKIANIFSTTVYPSERESFRVPFGTGQRVTRFLNNFPHNLISEYRLYNPIIFEKLSEWLTLFYKDDFNLSKISNLSEESKAFLHEFDFTETWNKILKNSKKEEQIKKQKSFWFDGFRTLKFVHLLREKYYPDVHPEVAVKSLLKKYGHSNYKFDYHNLNDQKNVLLKLREIEKTVNNNL